MKRIKLTRGRYAIVDNADYEWLNQWKWCVVQSRYAHRSAGRGEWIRMHRLIIDAPKGFHVDHINGDGLDNRRSNLRLCNPSQNLSNRGPNRNSKSGVKDVFWQNDRQKWFVQVMKNGKRYNGGRFDELGAAVRMRDKLIGELHGEFARG